jgi:hypothetical protein
MDEFAQEALHGERVRPYCVLYRGRLFRRFHRPVLGLPSDPVSYLIESAAVRETRCAARRSGFFISAIGVAWRKSGRRDRAEPTAAAEICGLSQDAVTNRGHANRRVSELSAAAN